MIAPDAKQTADAAPSKGLDPGSDSRGPCPSEWWDDFWRANSEPTEARISPGHCFLGARGVLVRTLGQVMDDAPLETLCEFGGGGGLWLMAVARWTGARATCVDTSPHGLAMTGDVFDRTGMDIELIHADLFAHDFNGRRFDLVSHWGLIEHFREPLAVFEKTAQVLAPSGLTVFSMPNMLAFGARWWRAWAPVSWAHHILHTDEQIARDLDRAGLELVTSRCFGGVLFHPARWEKHSLGTRLASFGQRIANAVQCRSRALWTKTPRWCAKHRLFVARHKPTG